MRIITRGRSRALLVGLATGLTVVSALPGVSQARTGAAAKPQTGGTLTIGTNYEITTLDPVRATLGSPSSGTDRMLLVFGTLMRFNSKNETIIPGLAESVTTTDAQTWTLKLRPNVKFSDGTPLDADAVIFNYQRFQDPANTFAGIGLVSQISKMTKVDPLTVEFKLVQPNGSFAIVFTDAAGAMGSPAAIKADPKTWGQKPVGAGPYLMKEWIRDQQITFVRNPNYFDKPRPYIDTIVEKIYKEVTTLAQTLQAGTLDAVHTGNAVLLKAATDSPKTLRAWDPAKTNGAISLACNLDRPPCNDIRYREALSLSFDTNLGKRVFLPDVKYPSKEFVCPPWGTASPFCAKDVKIRFNPARAKKLFDEVRADGISTDLTYTFNREGVLGPSQGEWIQQQLAKVGVKVEVRSVSNTESTLIATRKEFQAKDIANPTTTDMSTRFYNDWHSSGGIGGGRDVANLNNAQLDVALEKGRNSLKLADRIAGMQEAQRIMAKNFLVMWLYPYVAGNVYKKTVHLPDWVDPNAYLPRYDEAWIDSNK